MEGMDTTVFPYGDDRYEIVDFDGCGLGDCRFEQCITLLATDGSRTGQTWHREAHDFFRLTAETAADSSEMRASAEQCLSTAHQIARFEDAVMPKTKALMWLLRSLEYSLGVGAPETLAVAEAVVRSEHPMAARTASRYGL